MWRFLRRALPIILNSGLIESSLSRNVQRAPVIDTGKIARKAMWGSVFALMIFLTIAFFSLAGFVWVSSIYGYSNGFIMLGVLTGIIALIAFIAFRETDSKSSKTARQSETGNALTAEFSGSGDTDNDLTIPSANDLVEQITQLEPVQELTEQIERHPFSAMAIAFAIGMAITSR